MKKLIAFFYLATSALLLSSQTLGGYIIYDYLVNAEHPYGCSSDYVTGLPDDSTWVNFNGGDLLNGIPGDMMTGNFGFTWTDSIGNELLLETCYHPDNYKMRLILSSGLGSSVHMVNTTDWVQISDTPWVHLSTDCVPGTQGNLRYILPLDFNQHFGLSAADTVAGIEIEFLLTTGSPDLAGAYIIKEPDCNAFDLGNDTSLCQDAILPLHVSLPGATYLWQNNSTSSFDTVSQEGVYWVEVTINNCIKRDSINVLYIPSPAINLGNDTSLCPGEILSLNVTTLNAEYIWQDYSTNPKYTITQPGMYWVELTLNNCSNRDTIQISYVTISPVNLGKDTNLCENEILPLNVTTSNAAYLWNDNSINPEYYVTQPGLYWVEVTVNNCSERDSINISYTPFPEINLGNDTSLCESKIVELDVSTANATYLWQDNSTNPSYTVTQKGTYWAEVTINNCSSRDFLTVDYIPLPLVDFAEDSTLCPGTTFRLEGATSNANYLWQDNSTNPSYTVTQKGTYWLRVYNSCGLHADTITINYDDCKCYIHIPNAFSPSGEGINDNFSPSSNCNFSEYRLMIFNRWGDVIFNSTDPYSPWNGLLNGKAIANGVYVYLIMYRFENEETITKYGMVTLIR